jgi:hypothetical protein
MKTSPIAKDASVMWQPKYGSSRLPELYIEISMFYQIIPARLEDVYL